MITVTETAAKQVIKIKQDDNKSDAYLRIKAVPGGCSGMSYKLDFDLSQTPEDKTFEAAGVKIVVDKKSYLYLVGMTLDYEGGLNGQGFVFNNPNASRTCGCGSSFGV